MRFEILFDADKCNMDAAELMKVTNDVLKRSPLTIQVDNTRGSVIFTFEDELSKKDKEKLTEEVNRLIRESERLDTYRMH